MNRYIRDGKFNDLAGNDAFQCKCETHCTPISKNVSSVLFIGINPPTDTNNELERTTRKKLWCVGRLIGAEEYRIVNLFPIKEQYKHNLGIRKLNSIPPSDVEANVDSILKSAQWADFIIAFWGVPLSRPRARERFDEQVSVVRKIIQSEKKDIHAIDLTRENHPAHIVSWNTSNFHEIKGILRLS